MSDHEWLSALIQEHAHQPRSVVLELSHHLYGTAILCVGRQRVLFARHGVSTGEEAFQQIMRWGKGTLEATYHIDITPNIDRTLASLMLDARLHLRDGCRRYIFSSKYCTCNEENLNTLSQQVRRQLSCQAFLGLNVFSACGICMLSLEGLGDGSSPALPSALEAAVAALKGSVDWELLFTNHGVHHVVMPLGALDMSLQVTFDAQQLNMTNAHRFVATLLRTPEYSALLHQFAEEPWACRCEPKPLMELRPTRCPVGHNASNKL